MRDLKDSEGWGKGLLKWEAPDLVWDLELPKWKLDIEWQISLDIVQPSGRAESLINWGLDGIDSEINHYSISRDLGYFEREMGWAGHQQGQ